MLDVCKDTKYLRCPGNIAFSGDPTESTSHATAALTETQSQTSLGQ